MLELSFSVGTQMLIITVIYTLHLRRRVVYLENVCDVKDIGWALVKDKKGKISITLKMFVLSSDTGQVTGAHPPIGRRPPVVAFIL